MTTALTRDNLGQPLTNTSLTKATPFSSGAGHVRPNRATDSGLIYDLTPRDYLKILCSLGLALSLIAACQSQNVILLGWKIHHFLIILKKLREKIWLCPINPIKRLQPTNIPDLNYSSITLPTLDGSLTVTRTVKNVAYRIYKLSEYDAHPGSVFWLSRIF